MESHRSSLTASTRLLDAELGYPPTPIYSSSGPWRGGSLRTASKNGPIAPSLSYPASFWSSFMQIKGREPGVGGYPNSACNNLVDAVNDDRCDSKGMFLETISSTGYVSLRSSSPSIFQISPLSLIFRAAFGRDSGV